MLGDSIRIEEERGADLGLGKEIGGQGGDPLEDGEPSTGLEHEECNSLLEEQPNDDSWPWDEVTLGRGGPETELEDEETEDRNGAIAIFGILARHKKSLSWKKI